MDYHAVERNLPETIPASDVLEMLVRIYKVGVPERLPEKQLQANLLWELATRQWHNYQRLPETALAGLHVHLKSMLQEPLSVELAETVLGVILNLGMQDTMDAMRLRIHDCGGDLPARFIQELNAIPADISDPYDESQRF